MYYSGSVGVAVVYDVTSRESFLHAEWWIDKLTLHGRPDAQHVLVGNKCDLHGYRKVSFEEGMQLANLHSLSFLECSAAYETNISALIRLLLSLTNCYRYLKSPVEHQLEQFTCEASAELQVV